MNTREAAAIRSRERKRGTKGTPAAGDTAEASGRPGGVDPEHGAKAAETEGKKAAAKVPNKNRLGQRERRRLAVRLNGGARWLWLYNDAWCSRVRCSPCLSKRAL